MDNSLPESLTKLNTKRVIPFKFLRYSCVPESQNVYQPCKKSFEPGPGRYDLFEDGDGILFEIQRADQKRLKFRRLPYKQLSTTKPHKSYPLYHIFGFGFTRLFRGPPTHQAIVTSKNKKHKSSDGINSFVGFDYIKMINWPTRSPLTKRDEPLKKNTIRIQYNCTLKVICRRQLSKNKNKSFNISSRLAQGMNASAKNAVTSTSSAIDMSSRLYAVPRRFQKTVKENRIRPFKFQRVPIIKLLLDESEVQPKNLRLNDILSKEFSVHNFFRDEFKK